MSVADATPGTARAGLYGGVVSSKQERPSGPGGKSKTPPKWSVILADAWELVRARRGRLSVGFALIAVNRACSLVLPGTTKFLLDEVIGQQNRDMLLQLVLVAGAATLLQAITSFSLTQVVGKAAHRSITEVRRAVQRHVGRLPVGYFDRTKSGALLSRVMNDADGLRNLVGTGVVEMLGGILTAFLAVAILFSLSPRLTLLVIAVLTLFAVIMQRSFKVLRPLFRDRSRIQAELSGRLTESFAGVRVVKVYRAERRESLVFAKGAHRLFRNIVATLTRMSLIGALTTLLLGLLSVAVMAIGAHEVLAGRMTVGSFFSFTLYLGLLVGPVTQVVNLGGQLIEAFAGLERIREIRNEALETDGEVRRQPVHSLAGRVELRDVWFEYQEDAPVLRGLSFVAEPGMSVALVGSSGSGKSTLIGLVAAFHNATAGQVLVDGRDLSTLRLSDYRSRLGVVFQETFLFDGTVFENIAYARPDASREEILEAARIAGCDMFAAKLPDGYGTVVGERGVKLSGGERQRVAIARAILADPRILILDEATSSLDSESEELIQRGLAELMKGRTTFVIAHRLSTIRNADLILVLEHGQIVERGRHQELLALGGRYHALYTRQHNLESNLFLNPGENTAPAKTERAARPLRDSDAGLEPISLLGA